MNSNDSVWVVNDFLTCIPGTRTFWHMLLEINGCVDKTGCSYSKLPDKIESDNSRCDLIIRNATFFRPLNRKEKTIAFVQDRYDDDTLQMEVCNMADCVVYNSDFTKSFYSKNTFKREEVIPIGVDEDLFKSFKSPRLFDNNNPVGIFVGDYNETKGTRVFEEVAHRMSDVNFIYVSKLGNKIKAPNVQNYRGATEHLMSILYNYADFSIMCSPRETLHLVSIEAALCNKPVIGTDTGWLATHLRPSAGTIVATPSSPDSYVKAIRETLAELDTFSPREHILTTPFVWRNCKESWEKLIGQMLS